MGEEERERDKIEWTEIGKRSNKEKKRRPDVAQCSGDVIIAEEGYTTTGT